MVFWVLFLGFVVVIGLCFPKTRHTPLTHIVCFWNGRGDGESGDGVVPTKRKKKKTEFRLRGADLGTLWEEWVEKSFQKRVRRGG